jgi:superfamily II DNA or RNA helicase
MVDFNPFKTKRKGNGKVEDIEILFKDLPRKPHIDNLPSYQADTLREYQANHVDTPDVGIELPTGSGKTLVGLLIGEWRRINLNQRVLYLCPTKQLAKQVGRQSEDYGIETSVFVGSKYYFNTSQVTRYRQSSILSSGHFKGVSSKSC